MRRARSAAAGSFLAPASSSSRTTSGTAISSSRPARSEVAQLGSGERSGFAEMELAGTALIGQIRASRELEDSVRAVESFPRLYQLMAEGLVFVPTFEAILLATRRCTPEVQLGVDARLA